jgi:hypothetical protein
MARSQRDDTFPAGVQESTGTDEQRTRTTLNCHCDGGLDITAAAHIESEQLLSDPAQGGLDVSQLRRSTGIARIRQHGNRRRLGHELAQQLQPLRSQHGVEEDHAGDVATRPVEAGDDAVPDRVAPARDDEWCARGCGFGREPRRGIADDHRRLPADQIRYQSRQPIGMIFRRAGFDGDVPALDEARFLEALAERGNEVQGVGQRRASEESDNGHRRLLCPRHQRPRRRATHQRDEGAPFHSITSSAVARSDAGTVRPSMSAV